MLHPHGKALCYAIYYRIVYTERIPGTDFAGIVESVGKNVTSLKPGDKVWGFDDTCIGSQAMYMTFPENKAILTIPENLSFEEATASAEGAHYALNFINKIKLRAGEKVMLNGATGAIGSAALQFLKYHGAYVTAVCNTKNIDLVKSLGADRVIDYNSEDFTKDGERYHYLLDAVGKSAFGKCKHLLLPGGVYISSELGPNNENLLLPITTRLRGRKKVIFPFPYNITGSLRFTKELIEKGKFKPVIDRIYPMEEIQEAYRFAASGEKTGNVVIRIE